MSQCFDDRKVGVTQISVLSNHGNIGCLAFILLRIFKVGSDCPPNLKIWFCPHMMQTQEILDDHVNTLSGQHQRYMVYVCHIMHRDDILGIHMAERADLLFSTLKKHLSAARDNHVRAEAKAS